MCVWQADGRPQTDSRCRFVYVRVLMRASFMSGPGQKTNRGEESTE